MGSPHAWVVSPNTMIPLAEQSGLIAEIGRWALEQACVDHNADADAEGLMLSVNVSAHQLMAPKFVDMVEAILTETNSDPNLLTLEITEGALLRDTQRAHVVLHGLKELGLLLALDDFGTGYSSLSYLKRFPVDIIKIDQSFIADLVRDQPSSRHRIDDHRTRTRARPHRRLRGCRDSGAAPRRRRDGEQFVPGLLLRPALDDGRDGGGAAGLVGTPRDGAPTPPARVVE